MFFRVFLAPGLLAAMGAAAFAGGGLSGNGVATGPSASAPHPVAENHALVDIGSTYDRIVMEDSAHPLHGGTGPCFGAVEMSAGAANGGGLCLFTDAEGDKLVLQWHADGMDADGALTGTWELTSGTGKWNGATGGGTFASATDEAAGTVENNFTSEIEMP
ncbi:hypothetical protein ACUXV3_07700 [Roseobacteraceae bacterium NS-SX3]